VTEEKKKIIGCLNECFLGDLIWGQNSAPVPTGNFVIFSQFLIIIEIIKKGGGGEKKRRYYNSR
jgi:hypothetical protein